MSLPTREVLRGLRAASLGFVGFVLALVAHVAAGGVTPRPAALLLLAGLIGLAAVLLTGARLSPVRVGMPPATAVMAGTPSLLVRCALGGRDEACLKGCPSP